VFLDRRIPQGRHSQDARLVGQSPRGRLEIGGRLLSRYRVFHPFDHCWARYVRRLPDGSIGPGAQIRICEFIARNPRYKTEVTARIEKLDEDGFILITPGNKRLWLLSQPVSAIMFTNTKGRAWLKHAIEEMGALENFLPQLYAREVGRESSPKQAPGRYNESSLWAEKGVTAAAQSPRRNTRIRSKQCACREASRSTEGNGTTAPVRSRIAHF
jgi:hypothetical protein